jgi:hypothetical protein
VQSPCNPLIEDYSKTFYIIDKGNIPSIECRTSLTEPKSIRNIDNLSLIFIDFYDPALTPVHSSIEISLQLSENITFAVCWVYTGVINKETDRHQVFGGYL